MNRIRERPNCRKVIERLLKDGHTLTEIAERNTESYGIRKQAQKMSLENITNKERKGEI